MAQLEYGYNTVPGVPGMKADSRFDEVHSFAAEAAIAPGAALMRGTNSQKQALPFDGSGEFLGIALQSGLLVNPAAGLPETEATYLETDPVNVLRKGACWVTVADDVTAGNPAYVTADGEFTAVGGAEDEAIGEFETDAEAETVAIVAINLP